MLTGEMEPPFDIPDDDAALLAECDVQTFHASGPGGQSVNTSDSAVRLHHRASGVTVTCRAERSQLQNKRACLRRLRERLKELNAPPAEPRRPTRKSRGVRASELEAKAWRARIKRLRRPPGSED
jgi:protein subunit release factor B